MTRLERLRNKAGSLPLSAGIYIMKNSNGEIIYVGKSKKLKNRVTSYFINTNHTPKTKRMVSLVNDFDYILCDTEMEALALENVLIKKHSPKYNVRLKDSKSYPYIKISAEEFPRLFVTRERSSDKAKYFGPYRSSEDARTALDVVMRIFSLPTCRRSFPKDIGRERPCIYRDMGRCIAPCAGGIEGAEYRALVKCAEWVLAGNVSATRELLLSSMDKAAENLEFERAAEIRDSIRALERLGEKQKVVADSKVNRDVFALYSSEAESILAMLTIRDGSLINKNEFPLTEKELSGEDIISIIADYYDIHGSAPKEIMLDFPLEDEEISLLSEYLSLTTKYKVVVKTPERGDARRLCDMALANAKEAEKQRRLSEQRENKNIKLLTELLRLPALPKRIEAYDISNIGKEHITASMVVYKDGKLKRQDYRSFNIKTVMKAPDDYASMREAISRRISHIGDGTASLGECPDLILVDGGAGHVAAAKSVLGDSYPDISLFGMVKDDYHKTRALTDGKNDISIAANPPVYSFVYNLQEEAHRFALKHSQDAKKKTLTHSSLEKIKGIGPSKAKILLSAMSLSEIRAADEKTLSAIKGISKNDAKRVYEYFKERKTK